MKNRSTESSQFVLHLAEQFLEQDELESAGQIELSRKEILIMAAVTIAFTAAIVLMFD